MGWSFPWVSSADGDFNFDFGVSYTDAQVRERMWAMLEGDTPPVFIHLASETGTDVAGYLSEVPGFSAFGLAEGAVYHTYSTYARGLEFLMGYYRSSTGRRWAATSAARPSCGSVGTTSASTPTPRRPGNAEGPPTAKFDRIEAASASRLRVTRMLRWRRGGRVNPYDQT